ncbi:MAG: efflux RND transporter periplasmic adaptor subunit [Pseudomonadales bacterium]
MIIRTLSSTAISILTTAATYLLLVIGDAVFVQHAVAQADTYRVPVTTVKAQQERRVVPVYSSGKLANKSEFRLGFKTAGIINTIEVEEGQRVDAGQVLATLNLKEVNARLESAKTQQQKALRDYRRLEKIYRQKVITLEQLQNARSNLQLAEAELQIAQFNRQYSTITAPSSGRVLKRLAETDELITAGEPAFLLAADARGWVVRVGLADKDIVRLQLGDTATLGLDAFPGAVLNGEVSEIAAVASEQTGVFEVEIAVIEPPAQLRSGFIARVNIAPSLIEPLIYLPLESVVAGSKHRGEVYVYDPQSSQVQKRVVGIAYLSNNEVAIRAGVVGQEHVVAKGAAYLRDGMQVMRIDDAKKEGAS